MLRFSLPSLSVHVPSVSPDVNVIRICKWERHLPRGCVHMHICAFATTISHVRFAIVEFSQGCDERRVVRRLANSREWSLLYFREQLARPSRWNNVCKFDTVLRGTCEGCRRCSRHLQDSGNRYQYVFHGPTQFEDVGGRLVMIRGS